MEVGGVGAESGRGEIEEEEEEEEQQQQQEEVYFAVAKEGKESMANLQWALANVRRSKKLVLAHVHCPASRINMMGAWVPVSRLAEEEVAAYRQLEKEKIDEILDDFLDICRCQKVNASKIVIESDDTARGLIKLIEDHGVTELVMGAASDGRCSRRMRAPRSKKALTVQRKADPSCKIWFVCKGNLICTREVGEGLSREDSSPSSTSTRSSTSEYSRSKSSPRLHSEPLSMQEPVDPTSSSSLVRTPSREEDNAMERSAEAAKVAAGVGEESAGIRNEAEEDSPMSPRDGSDDAEIDDALYEKLKDALMEAENFKSEAYEESHRRQKAERDLADASRRAKGAESSYLQEVKLRKETEESLARERMEMDQDKQQLHGILDEIEKANERSAALELRIANSERTVSDFEGRLSESYRLLETFRLEHRRAPLRRDDPAGECRKSHQNVDHKLSFFEFTHSELEQATNNFDVAAKIGEGAHGSVYKGFLRDMTVAVKVLHPEAVTDELEFAREVEIVSRVRHPHLVTLVGACPKAHAIVYEFLPNGSLEDHLRSESQTPALTWHARACIAYKTCSALIFLHSSEPRPIVHGDLKPENVLLDENFSSKLADFGIRALLDRSHTVSAAFCRRARAALAYVDPHYLATGELTPQCDVYSFGVLLLRLLTGKPALRAKKAVQEAVGSGSLHEVLDASAGDWPLEHAKEMALLSLKCCDINRRRGPELVEEARRVLETVTSAAPRKVSSSRSFGSDAEGHGSIPSYFLCPIFKEIMKHPQIAADGFTYEAEAIKGWLEGGHDTSPMTNLKLASSELIPNHALRSAIQEWLQKP